MPPSRRGTFYGWRIVFVCFVAATFTWGLSVFGASVYLNEVTKAQGWSISLVSGGITVLYLTSALSQAVVGSAIDRLGSRPVFVFGALALASGVAWMGRVAAPWQLFAAFVVMGLGYASMSLTAISATIAPWFERHQGRSVAMALTGASMGAMVVVPLMVTAIGRFGFAAATLGGACLLVAVMVPLALIVLRWRTPEALGLAPDGDAVPAGGSQGPAAPVVTWTRARALATPALWTVSIAFALGMTIQVGFFTHQVKLAEPVLGSVGAGWLVGATGLAGLLGRLILARIADRVPLRRYTAAILAGQGLVLAVIAFTPLDADIAAAVLIGGCFLYGFCLGQITTLSPIVVRREFGARSYGAIFGIVATITQFSSAFGPALYGLLRDLSGGYGPVLTIAAAVEFAAMAAILAGRAPPLMTAAASSR